MKIGIFVDSLAMSIIDFKNVDICNSNPGLGGTQYEMIRYACEFSKTHDVILFANKKIILSNETKFKFCLIKDLIDCYNSCNCLNVDILIVQNIPKIVFKERKFKIIGVLHNFVEIGDVNECGKKGYTDYLCSVSKYEHTQLYLSKWYRKHGFWIYNFIPNYSPLGNDILKKEHNFLFIGNPSVGKGFDYLIEQWPKVLQLVPDARLFVIGSQQLYGNNSGNITDFMINNPNDCELKSINFFGLKCLENIQETLFDITACFINPKIAIGHAETFCIAATDCGRYEIPIIYAKGGALDETIGKKYGFRINKNSKFLKTIIKCANNKKQTRKKTLKYKKKTKTLFNSNSINKKWFFYLDKVHKNTFFKFNPFLYCNSYIMKIKYHFFFKKYGK